MSGPLLGGAAQAPLAGMDTLGGLLQGIAIDPPDEDRWLVLADYFQERDDPRRAELLRLHRRLLGTCCEPDAHPERAAWQGRMVELLGQGVKPCVPRRVVSLADGVDLALLEEEPQLPTRWGTSTVCWLGVAIASASLAAGYCPR